MFHFINSIRGKTPLQKLWNELTNSWNVNGGKLEYIVHPWIFFVHSMNVFSFGVGLKSHGLVSTMYGIHEFFPFNVPKGAKKTLWWGKLFRGNRCKKMEAWFLFKTRLQTGHDFGNDETGCSWEGKTQPRLTWVSPTESLEKIIQIKAAGHIFLLLASFWGSSIILTQPTIVTNHPDFNFRSYGGGEG